MIIVLSAFVTQLALYKVTMKLAASLEEAIAVPASSVNATQPDM